MTEAFDDDLTALPGDGVWSDEAEWDLSGFVDGDAAPIDTAQFARCADGIANAQRRVHAAIIRLTEPDAADDQRGEPNQRNRRNPNQYPFRPGIVGDESIQ